MSKDIQPTPNSPNRLQWSKNIKNTLKL
jgi:hypothetical protein